MGSRAGGTRTGTHMGSPAFKARTLAARPPRQALDIYIFLNRVRGIYFDQSQTDSALATAATW